MRADHTQYFIGDPIVLCYRLSPVVPVFRYKLYKNGVLLGQADDSGGTGNGCVSTTVTGPQVGRVEYAVELFVDGAFATRVTTNVEVLGVRGTGSPPACTDCPHTS